LQDTLLHDYYIKQINIDLLFSSFCLEAGYIAQAVPDQLRMDNSIEHTMHLLISNTKIHLELWFSSCRCALGIHKTSWTFMPPYEAGGLQGPWVILYQGDVTVECHQRVDDDVRTVQLWAHYNVALGRLLVLARRLSEKNHLPSTTNRNPPTHTTQMIYDGPETHSRSTEWFVSTYARTGMNYTHLYLLNRGWF